MFSYRHAFHVGNHADVLKHAILVAVLRHLALKDKSFWVFDTHAGAARYRLDAAQTRKNAEYRSGIQAVWQAKRLPSLLADYREEVMRFDAARQGGHDGAASRELSGVLPRWYPGSPWLALQLMRPQDRLRCFEAHPSEIRVLQESLQDANRRQVQIFGEDGFSGLKALLPPLSRRGLVVMDPSYEDKRDYAKVRRALIEALERFATGTMLLWYPLTARREAMLLMSHLPRLPGIKAWLDARLQVAEPPADGYGLYGSGVFVINPPYTLEAALREALPVLHQLLGQDAHAGWFMQSSGATRPLGSRQIGPLAEESFLDRARGGQPGGTRAPARQGRSGVAGGQQGRPAPRRRPGPAARG